MVLFLQSTIIVVSFWLYAHGMLLIFYSGFPIYRLSGLSPFAGEDDYDTLINVGKAEYDFDDEAFDNVSDLAKDFISKLLLKKPE